MGIAQEQRRRYDRNNRIPGFGDEGQEKLLQSRVLTGEDLFGECGAAFECSENFSAKFRLNDLCLRFQKPFVPAGNLASSGQGMYVVPGRTPCLRCAVSEALEGASTMADLGVPRAVPGVLSSLEALELIRYLWVCGAPCQMDGDDSTVRTATPCA